MTGEDGAGEVIEEFLTGLASVALACRLGRVMALLGDPPGRAVWTSHPLGPSRSRTVWKHFTSSIRLRMLTIVRVLAILREHALRWWGRNADDSGLYRRAGGRIQPPGIPDEPCLFFVFLVLGWTWPSLGHADSHVEKAILKPHTVHHPEDSSMRPRTTRGSRRSRTSARRSMRPMIDDLEPRVLLSTAPMLVAYPTFEILRPLAGGGGPAGGYTPAQIQQAYGFNNITFGGVAGNGQGPDDRHRRCLRRPEHPGRSEHIRHPVRAARHDGHAGQPDRRDEYPASDSTGGWELEESLDVEWAHAMAPGASIMLVEASSTSYSDLLAAVNYAAAHANVVSMSWGGGEFSGEASVRYPILQPAPAWRSWRPRATPARPPRGRRFRRTCCPSAGRP